MAEAIYNKLTNSQDANSAGTHVEAQGETLGARKKRVGRSDAVDVMNDHGLIPNDKQQTQLTKDMLSEYDLVVSMAAKRYTPKWLSSSPKYVYWKITDPKGRGYEITNRTRQQIERKIREIT